ncbi:transposable element Tcb2 transposase [Trichonephila clavipes]|nr:transposable element Tcb2 transposase [Trichonephila clavipes]
MSERSRLPYSLRWRAVGWMKMGLSQADAARRLNVSRSVVHRLWNQYQTEVSVSRRHVPGQPRATTPAGDRFIALSARRRRISVPQLVADHSVASGRRISASSVRSRLHDSDIYARQRWASVLFTEDSRFTLESDSGRLLIWRKQRNRYHHFNTVEKHSYRGGGIMVTVSSPPPRSLGELEQSLLRVWSSFPISVTDNLIDSMENRCSQCIQAREKLTVWCALWAGGITGPYFFKNDEGHNVTVNGDRYRAMITNFFIPELNNHDVQELWFQQDGATCHTARAAIDLLKDMFGDRLISRFGPVNWPPRSCDLTPLDYFLWGYVKSLVYADKPQTLDPLEDNIRRVIADRRPQMLEKVIEN